MRGFEQLLNKKKNVGQVASEGKWPSVQSDPIQLSIFSYFLKSQVGGTKPCHHGIVYKPDWIQSSWYLHSSSLSLGLPLSRVHTHTHTRHASTHMHTHAHAQTCTHTWHCLLFPPMLPRISLFASVLVFPNFSSSEHVCDNKMIRDMQL